MEKQIIQAKEYIAQADAVLITAGAGMGVDSGLPDFRGDEGFWKEYPVIKELGFRFVDMANPSWFKENPKFAWAFYGHRLNLYRKTIPHEGFTMLLDLVKSKDDNYFIYTSNVDGQFQKAGFSSDKIVEVHGSIHHFQCSNICQGIWEANVKQIDIDMQKFEALTIPKCINCECVARPNIMMFNDWNWESRRTVKQEYRFNMWIKSIKKQNKKLAIIEIGAGTSIPTVRIKGKYISKNYKNSKLFRINPREYEIGEKLGIGFGFSGLEGIKKLLS